MKVTNVSLRPTEAALQTGRPALTPELLAASGARYSRNNEGLGSILSKIDVNNLDKSVDSIFRMIDYGHQSIADMVPVAMFIDDVSIHLAYLVWSWSSTAGGQESSTRYIQLGREGLIEPSLLGVPEAERRDWLRLMDECFAAYGAALGYWEAAGRAEPALTRIPSALLSDGSDKAQRQVARMRRNYAFDRARYFLPVAAKTNLMLVMSARAWVQLCQNLLSHALPEATLLGAELARELALSAPRMLKHAAREPSYEAGHQEEARAARAAAVRLGEGGARGEAECAARAELWLPPDLSEGDLVAALSWHAHRYAHVGDAARRAAIRFSWSAMAMAEIRDLNRHRTGQKHCPLVPRGFYWAADQLPAGSKGGGPSGAIGDDANEASLRALRDGRADFAAWTLLGTQYSFEHTTTLDKYVYEAELRTGTGGHYRYARHLRDSVDALRSSWPALAGAIKLGEAEPE